MEVEGSPKKAMEVEKESHKDGDPDGNIAKGASKVSSAEKNIENGARVCVNGDDDLGGGEVVQKKGIEGKDSILNDFGERNVISLNEEGNLEDSEMSGASSLLKIKESGGLKGLGSVFDVIDNNKEGGFESAEKEIGGFGGKFNGDLLDSKGGSSEVEFAEHSEDGEGDGDMGDVECEFNVGDFVWGKIRSHPWWPGRIYDPIDASDYAMKVKPKDRILVAYFGDGTFAWCNPSQLKPFEENFAEMSKQSSSKNFVNAVEKAVQEVGRLVELEMICSCVPKEDLIGFGRSLAVNAGIKEGILVPDGGIERFSTASFKPAEVIAAMKCIARVATMSNMLELSVLKSWLSAFYHAKGGYQLPTYHDPQPVPGLEDDNRNWVVDLSSYGGGTEVNIGGPVEEDWLSSPRGFKLDQTTNSAMQKCQGVPDGSQYQRRKQKSIAEILGGNLDTEAESKDDDVAEEEKKLDKLASVAKRKKRKDRGGIEGRDLVVEKTDGDMAREEAITVKSASSSGGKKKKRKGHDEADDEGKYDMVGMAEAGIDSGKPVSSTKGKKRKGSDETNLQGSIDLTTKLRRRKDTKPAESLIASENLVDSPEVNGSGTSKESRKSSLSRRKKKPSNVENDGEKSEIGEDIVPAEKKMVRNLSIQSDDGGEQTPKGFLSRERKKSKYLSYPYMNVGVKKKEMELESLMVSNGAEMGEQGTKFTKAAGPVIGSPRIVKDSNKKIQKEEASEEPSAGHKKSDDSGPETPKQDQNNIIDPVKVKAPSKEILQHIQSTALNPQCLDENNFLEVVREFSSVFRSSVYCNGSNYKMYRRHQRGRKRKSRESEPGPPVKEPNQADHGSADPKSLQTKARKSEESKLDKRKAKQAASAADRKTNHKGSERKPSERGSSAKMQDQSYHSSPDHKTRQTKISKDEAAKSDKPKVKQAAIAPDVKTNNNEADGKTPAAALFVTFGPGANMPDKNDLIRIYGKFGVLNKEETEMFYNNHCARIVFLNSGEAEEAFNDSQLASPFGAANVNFRLRYLSGETKTREIKELASPKPSSPAKDGAKTLDKPSAASEAMQLKNMKQKLEGMISMLETSDGKMSPGIKSKLEGDMKSMLKALNSMVESSS